MTQSYLPRDVESKFRFITVASQRAKQLQCGAKPRVDTESRKATTVAVEETIAGTVSWEVMDKLPGEGEDLPIREERLEPVKK